MSEKFKVENGVLIRYSGNRKHVTIPEGIAVIGNRAFEGCKNLEEIVIPEGVREIRATAFATCRKLRFVSLPRSLMELGEYAFTECESLTKIDLRSDLKVIRNNTFDGCRGLKKVILPDGLARIGSEAFKNCESLGQTYLPDSLAEIERKAFANCGNLKIGRSSGYPVRVAKNAFPGCDPAAEAALKGIPRADTALTEPGSAVVVTVRDLRKHSGADRLMCTEIMGCRLIVDQSVREGQPMVLFPSGCQLEESFARNNHLLEEKDENGKRTEGYVSCRTRAIRPVWLRGEISEGLLLPLEALSAYTDITKLKEGDRFTSLEGRRICRFYYPPSYDIDSKGRLNGCSPSACRNPEIRIPYGVRIIGEGAFRNNTGIRTVRIPYTVEVIEEGAFAGSSLEDVFLSQGLRYIGEYAFASCRGLKSIDIPGSTESIGSCAFSGCWSLKALTIRPGVRYIGQNAFENCAQMETIDLPDSIRAAGTEAFAGCAGAKRINIPESLKVIGEAWGVTPLENLTMTQYSLKHAFEDGVVFSRDRTELIHYPPDKKDAFYTVPACVRKIRERAFFGNEHLTEVILPDGVQDIGHRAFENCRNLKRITIPESVTSMGNFVFIGIHTSPNTKRMRLSSEGIGKTKVKTLIAALNSLGTSEGILIRGKRGSEAERYAVTNGCPFEYI